jgi:WhiB family redox-sensing transcriptional regulator
MGRALAICCNAVTLPSRMPDAVGFVGGRLPWDDRVDVVALIAQIRRPGWMRDALCREHPEVDFFPTRGQSTAPAKAVCASCLVRAECATYAVEHDEAGIWGGTSERGRRGGVVQAHLQTDGLQQGGIGRQGSAAVKPKGAGQTHTAA